MPATVICFETYRSQRIRRDLRAVADEAHTTGSPFEDRLARVLSSRQIAHRRTMLDYARQLRIMAVSPISRSARRSGSPASASWIRSIGSMNPSLLSRND